MSSRSLHRRLTFRLALLLLGLAAILTLSITSIAERYRAEVAQRLNAGVAMYVTNELALIDRHGVNRRALEELAHRAMTVNPTAEIYLLAPDGEILATVIDRSRLKRKYVDLEPIRKFLSGGARRPLYGDDPTSLTRSGVFSVAPVNIHGSLAGYLYVILASNRFATVSAAVRGNYTLQIALLVGVAILLLTLLAGAALFRQLTLPLRKLAADMHASSQRLGIAAESAMPGAQNEIAALRAQFALLSDKIHAQMQDIATRDTQRRELLANLSHDLRTPLASLHGHIETVLLTGVELGPKQREYLAIAHRESRHLQRLIDGLFELSKLESGIAAPQWEVFDIAELLHDVALRFRLRAQRLGLQIRADVATPLPPVRADLALIERALENLIDNSMKHTLPGGRLILHAKTTGTHIRVAVIDTGTGIDANHLPHVFDRQYRAGSGGGAGLGLAIVKKIVELHGGRIDVAGTGQKGTRVEFTLPIADSGVTRPTSATHETATRPPTEHA